MRKNKFLGASIEAQIQHGHKGQDRTDGEDQIQREQIAEHTVDYGRKCRSADGGRAEEAEDRSAICFGQSQHKGGIEYGVAHTVHKGTDEDKDAHEMKMVR